MKIEAHRKILLVAILTLLFVPLLANTAYGDNSISEFRLTTGIHAAEFDQFGYSVDISGDTAVVGAPFGESAYVYRFDGTDWKQEKQLAAPTSPPTSISYFGWDVAIDGDTLVVSDFNFLWLYGSVYVFTHSGDSWDEGQELITGPGVGASVAIDGNTILVGAPFTGLTYVFNNGETGWEEKPGIASPSISMPFFGWAVDLSGDTAVVGVPLTGSAYAFTRNEDDSWDAGQELITGPGVGAPVAVSGDTAVVGAPSSLPLLSQPPLGPGAVHVFKKQNDGTWQNQNLSTPAVDGFGASVAISGDRLVVGAPTDDLICPDDPSCNSGSVYLFRYDGENWAQDPLQPTLIPTAAPLPKQFDQFGSAVAIDSRTVVAGAVFGDDPVTIDSGSASVFILPSPNQPPIAKAQALPGEVKEGEPFTLDGTGSEDPDGDPLIFNWVQISGPEVDLDLDLALAVAANDKTNPAVWKLVAPELSDGCDTLVFQLTVTEDVDGGLTSDPVTVKIEVLPNNTIHSKLERKHRHWLSWHKYSFEGVKDQVVTLDLQADPDGLSRGERATLILKDKIRGARLYKKDRSKLPNTVTATLPADGEYVVYVVKQPWFCRGKNFKGDYILTLEGTCGKLNSTFRFSKNKCKTR
jgi:hypothetical protein